MLAVSYNPSSGAFAYNYRTLCNKHKQLLKSEMKFSTHGTVFCYLSIGQPLMTSKMEMPM